MAERFDILVVDDEPVITKAASRILSDEGFSVDEADDAESALCRVQQNSYSLVLCDLMLPRISGIELIGRFHETLPDTPVVLITGYATLGSAVQAFREGAFDFIPKPFDFAELVGVVRRGLLFAGAEPARRREIDTEEVAVFDAAVASGGLYALGGHVWAVPDKDGSARIGMGETFATLDDPIDEVELPNVGDVTLQGNRCVRMVNGRSVYRVWAPLSGRVIETDERVFKDAGRAGWGAACRQWVIRIVPSSLEEELGNLTRR